LALTHLSLFQNVHAVGDRAHGIVLDAFENALAGANVTELRPRLEHAQMMTRAQMSRLGKLGGESRKTITNTELRAYL
jgi:predicted amidohydrolase YtcJ